MKQAPPTFLAGQPQGRAPRLAIGSIAVSGVDARTSGRLAAALERAVGDAVLSGALPLRDRDALHLELPHGADERAIAAALARALGRRR